MESIIKKYLSIEKKYEIISKEMENHFRELIQKDLDNAKTIDDFTKIKLFLRNMPDCSNKVFIFRTLLMRQDELGLTEN